MEAVAKVTHVRIAPRKVRIVIDLIRNKPVGVAMGILKNTPKAASPVVEKLLKSAMIQSNALRLFLPDRYLLTVAVLEMWVRLFFVTVSILLKTV